MYSVDSMEAVCCTDGWWGMGGVGVVCREYVERVVTERVTEYGDFIGR